MSFTPGLPVVFMSSALTWQEQQLDPFIPSEAGSSAVLWGAEQPPCLAGDLQVFAGGDHQGPHGRRGGGDVTVIADMIVAVGVDGDTEVGSTERLCSGPGELGSGVGRLPVKEASSLSFKLISIHIRPYAEYSLICPGDV